MTLVFGNTLKYIFYRSQHVRAAEDLKLSMANGKLRKLTSSLLENPKTPQKFIIIPHHSKFQLNFAKQMLGSIEI